MIKAIVFDAYGTLFDVQSVAARTEQAFPGRGEYITQVWRLKQLEYSWLRTMMGHFADFRTVTRDSLAYTLATLGLAADDATVGGVVDAYDALDPYPDAADTLERLAGRRLAILSNGSADMLATLVANSGLGRHFEAVISIDAKRAYKPDPRAYTLVEEHLGVAPGETAFVSSNGFDVAGAKAAGFRVVRIERVTPGALAGEIAAAGTIGPATMFKALRMQAEALDGHADATIPSLRQLPDALNTLDNCSNPSSPVRDR